MNIFEIEVELRSIFNEIEDNCGEITPELEERLKIGETDFRQKVESYTNLIKTLSYECDAIKQEQKRLKDLYDKKDKQINKLKDVLITAIDEFGETNKRGVKYYSYGTGEVAITKTKAVDVNSDILEKVETSLINTLTFHKGCNSLDSFDIIKGDEMLSNSDIDVALLPSNEELDNVNVTVDVTIPFKDLSNGKAVETLKEIVKYSDNYKLSTSISKTNVKPILEENGSAMPHLAKLVINKNLRIK